MIVSAVSSRLKAAVMFSPQDDQAVRQPCPVSGWVGGREVGKEIEEGGEVKKECLSFHCQFSE